MLCSTLTAPLLALIATSSILISDVSALPTRRSIGIKRLNNVVVARSSDSTRSGKSVIPNPKKSTSQRRSLQDAEDDYEDNREILATPEPYRFAKLIRSVVGGSKPRLRAVDVTEVEAVSFGKAFKPRSSPKHLGKRGGLLVDQDEEDDQNEVVVISEEDQATARLAKRSRIVIPNPKARVASAAGAHTQEKAVVEKQTTSKTSARASPAKVLRARSSMAIPKAGSKVRRAAIQPIRRHVYANHESSI
ncbi:BQ2448_304 [Microbotryum intermedium]|uniref:BQ2448_304 protein n=1 Tax=Microbotryum intermedium TaxID=269621 RepID=A0A238F833_9BASI|nr:BQ2448_304 [Microbotryum intermedium]